MNRSPEPAPAMPPIRPTPSAARRASRRSWCGSSGASVASTTMIEPCSCSRATCPAPGAAHARASSALESEHHGVVARLGSPELLRHRDSRDAELPPQAEVALHQRAHREAALLRRQPPARRADAALEAEALHAGAAAHVALGHRARPAAAASAANTCCFFTWKPKMSFRSPSQVSATTGRQQWSASGSRVGAPLDQRVAHRAHAVGVGDGDRIEQEAVVVDPRACRSSRRCR